MNLLLEVMLPVTLLLIAMGILTTSVMSAHRRLEKENAWLRARIHDLRAQVKNSVERPF